MHMFHPCDTMPHITLCQLSAISPTWTGIALFFTGTYLAIVSLGSGMGYSSCFATHELEIADLGFRKCLTLFWVGQVGNSVSTDM
ncbi:hypothetical protein BS17DRAFT_269155 [Gyrodon lividus]|nr:hypothetical protein BS17DRAFT_269155 [Gyrodon lividus]